MKKIDPDDFLAYSVGVLIMCYAFSILIVVIKSC